MHDIGIGIWKNLEIPPMQFFGSESRLLMTKNSKKQVTVKNFLNIYLIKNCN
jgi:hypothetical protein